MRVTELAKAFFNYLELLPLNDKIVAFNQFRKMAQLIL